MMYHHHVTDVTAGGRQYRPPRAARNRPRANAGRLLNELYFIIIIIIIIMHITMGFTPCRAPRATFRTRSSPKRADRARAPGAQARRRRTPPSSSSSRQNDAYACHRHRRLSSISKVKVTDLPLTTSKICGISPPILPHTRCRGDNASIDDIISCIDAIHETAGEASLDADRPRAHAIMPTSMAGHRSPVACAAGAQLVTAYQRHRHNTIRQRGLASRLTLPP